jgi:photosystem II stability/assembly factor-like uncharacterized protein
MPVHFVSGQGSLWAQRNGPNTEPIYLGCHQLGDVDQPEGDVELIYCPDPSGPSRFKVVGSVQGAAGAITTSITTDVTDELDELERAKCPFTLFAHMSKSGRKDVFPNFDRTFVFTNVRITNRGISNLVARTPDDNSRSEQSFDISSEALLRLKEPSINRQSIAETSHINDITFCNDETCRTDEQSAQAVAQLGFAATDAPAGSPGVTANVLKTTNGSTWTATASDPFAAAENIIGVECFDLGRDTTRVVVARGTTDASNPAEIAYSDDNGTTWSNVNVGSTNAEYAPTRFSLFAYDRNNIYLGTQAGRIYFSGDAGLSWEAVENQVIHSGAWNVINFVDQNVGWAGGAANILARTVDGGTGWSVITGPSAEAANAVTTIEVLDRNRVWVGYDSGNLYYTNDGGVNWGTRSFTGTGIGQVRDVKFFNDSLGFLATNNASPLGTVHWTIDGGYTWSTLTTPTNAGINMLYVADEWTVFAAGEAQGGTGYIAKGTV